MRRAIWVLVSALALACAPASPAREAPPPPTPRSDQADAGRQTPSPDAGAEDGGATVDGGSGADAGVPEDADTPDDAGTSFDGGALADGGTSTDAGTLADGGSALDGGSAAKDCPAQPDGGQATPMPEIPSATCLAEPVTESGSDLCETIRSRFGPPRTLAMPLASTSDTCAHVGSSDGEGHLAFGSMGDASWGPVQWTVVTNQGLPFGEFGSVLPSALMGQPHGFLTSEYLLGSANEYAGPLLVYDSDTRSGRIVQILEKPYTVASPAYYWPDPLGGAITGVWRYDWDPDAGPDQVDLRLYIWAGDSDGNARPGYPRAVVSHPACQRVFSYVTIMRGLHGDVLVNWPGDAFFGPGTQAAQWFDPSGQPETDVFQAAIPGVDELAPLLDGRIAVKVQGKWAYAFSPGQTEPEPAPCWLQRRPGTRLQLIHGLSAYALLPRGEAPCDQALEVLDGEGRSCGTFALDDASVSCDPNTVSIGADGTVLEQGPSTSTALPNGATVQVCNERWWSGLLR